MEGREANEYIVVIGLGLGREGRRGMTITAGQLKDMRWRLSNLYHVINRSGHDELFPPNEIQSDILNRMWYRNIVLKSRKRGTSTLIALLALDTALFQKNQNCQMINDTMNHAEELFERTIMYAYDHLPEEIKYISPVKTRTQRMVVFHHTEGSVIQVGTSSVGTTPTFLHVSELGKISFDTPLRAKSIQTGSIEAVASDGNQMVWIESTAWGKTGLFREMVDLARKHRDSGRRLSKLDMKLLFYPWHMGADNRLFESDQVISEVMEEYFRKLGVTLDIDQKRWYCKKYDDLGPDTLIQHPSTEDEPFSVAIEGAYFAHQFRRIYSEKRIGHIPIVEGIPIHTSWDYGINHDYMTIWFWQYVDGFLNAVDYYENSNQGMDHYVRVLEGRGYRYGTHYGPHDLRIKEISHKTRQELAAEMGLRFKVVPRIGHKMDAIEMARKILDHVKFDEVRCGVGITHLEQYRKKWNPQTTGWSDEPAETGDQHAADALMTMAQQNDFNFTSAVILGGDKADGWTVGRW